ncbi:MAG: FxsA family protein, partial [Sedimenticola sp.]
MSYRALRRKLAVMNPLFIFLLIFIGAPLTELYFLMEVGSVIGAIPTIALTVFTAVLGGMLVRLQGFATALRVRETMERGETPAIEVMEGVLLLLCGVLLLLPGFLTDIFGFLCLVP